MQTILVSGSLAYDHIMNYPDLFRNHFMADKLHAINVSFNIDSYAQHFGGTAGNIAYNLALLGEKPAIIATAGNDFERLRAHLEKTGVDTASIHIADDQPTAAAHIVTDKGNNQIAAFHLGAGGVPYGEGVPVANASAAIIAPGCLDDMRAFPAHYREKRIPFFFDPGQTIPALSADDLKNGIEGAEAVFANDYESALISQKTGWSEGDILEHAKMLVVTLGADGSRILTKGGEIAVGAVKTEAADPTGAGDAYRAGFLKAFRLGLPPAACAKLGSAVAVFAVEKIGTQEHSFTLDALKERYQAAYGETIAF